VGLIVLLAITGGLVGLLALVGILILWLTGRKDPPRREDSGQAVPFPLCLSPGCSRPRLTRGLCSCHYRQVARSVAEGETTWEALEQASRCLAARWSPWRGSHRWFQRE
jgi:hypothetical protein